MENKKKNPGGAPTKYKPEYCAMLVEHMKQGLSFDSFASKVGVCFDTLYEWVKVHPSFSEAKKIGKGFELQFWETVLRNGAVGINMEIPNQKIKAGTANASLIIFSLKNKFPRLYRDRVNLEADVKVSAEGFGELSEIEKTKILKAALDAKLAKEEIESE